MTSSTLQVNNSSMRTVPNKPDEKNSDVRRQKVNNMGAIDEVNDLGPNFCKYISQNHTCFNGCG